MGIFTKAHNKTLPFTHSPNTHNLSNPIAPWEAQLWRMSTMSIPLGNFSTSYPLSRSKSCNLYKHISLSNSSTMLLPNHVHNAGYDDTLFGPTFLFFINVVVLFFAMWVSYPMLGSHRDLTIPIRQWYRGCSGNQVEGGGYRNLYTRLAW